jgi:type I restriction enzyme S subunit
VIESGQNFIPSGWLEAELGEVAEIVRGIAFPKEAKYSSPGPGLIACLRTTNIQKNVDWSDLWYVPDEYRRSEAQLVRPYDVLISTANSSELVGKVAQVGKGALRATLGAFISLIRFSTELNPVFFYLQLSSPIVQSRIRRLASTTTNIANISTKSLAKVRLLVPSFKEQDRIVRVLEEKLAMLDSAFASLVHAERRLSRYRGSILRAACEGRLVTMEAELARIEGREYESGDALVRKVLNSRQISRRNHRFSSHQASQYREPSLPNLMAEVCQLPPGWAVASLEQITDPERVICYGILMPKEDVLGGVPYVRVVDLRDGQIDIRKLRRTSKPIAEKYARSSLQTGDLLLSIRGTYGRVAKVPSELGGGNITQDTARLAVSRQIDADYVSIHLKSPITQSWLRKVARGVAVKGVNIADIRTCPIFLPPRSEQARIVAEVQRRLSIVEEVEASVNASTIRSKRLRESILVNAFAGSLMPQALGDEPASVLLERIRQARAEQEREDPRPRRGRGIKPRVSTPGESATSNDAGSNQKSAHASSGLQEVTGGASLGLKPQALRLGPFGAGNLDENAPASVGLGVSEAGSPQEVDFLALPKESQIDLVWETLLGRGALEKDEAIRDAAGALRDRGFVRFQRLRQGGPLYEAIASALERGVRDGSFDRPRRGSVRALLAEAKEVAPEEWRLCLFNSLDSEPVPEEEALRRAAEWAREAVGLEFVRLREDGVILRGLRSALESAIRQGEVGRRAGLIFRRSNSATESTR